MDEFNEGGFHANSSKREYSGVRTLRNLTVKQISSIEVEGASSIYLVDNAEVSNIQVVGYIKSVKKTSAGIIFSLDDTTGILECTFWPNGSYDEIISQRIQENSLVKIVGSLKIFSQKKTLNSSSILIVDTNYLIFHLTSCLYQHLFYNNGLNRAEITHNKKLSIGLGKIQNDILEVYRSNQDENGLHVDVVLNMLKSKYSEIDIRENIENLIVDLHLYSVEGDYYRTTC